jgi:hypothetical protein
MDPKISKEKQISLFFSMSFEIFVSQNKFESLSFQYMCLHVISYNSKYVLFHLNMLRLFQEIIMFFFFEIKLIFKKKLLHYIPSARI